MSELTLAHRLRLRLRRAGIEVSRYPTESADYQAVRALLDSKGDVLLDVGAHRGEFVRACRSWGFHGQAVSFEPVAQVFGQLARAAEADPTWQVVNSAAGSEPGRATLHVAGNEAASSSLLAMLPRHLQAAPDSAYVADQEVDVVRLDRWLSANNVRGRLMLKIDVQGFEREVLLGLGERLSDVVALRVELSIRPLYDGSWTWLEAGQWLTQRGFELAAVVPGFRDPAQGGQLQFDGVFVRPDND